ncbi:MAG TPA: GatB/YqeY domain-containing protein, partial [Myxococcaceae bacterium]|nr:GatB/YqeY domain-containing protein [Myxococcaceae bacterium]
GAVMKILIPKIQGQAEGKAISDEVKAQLAKLG